MSTKDFLYIHQRSTKEGADTETERPHLEIFIDKTVSRKCMECYQLYYKNLLKWWRSL